MSPENQWLEDVFPIEKIPFWGTFVTVFGGVPGLGRKFLYPFLLTVGQANLATGLL